MVGVKGVRADGSQGGKGGGSSGIKCVRVKEWGGGGQEVGVVG